MEYTYQQKIAILRILLDIIHADGKIDAREIFFFNKLKDEFGLNDSDHEAVKKKNSLIALSQVKLLDDNQKKYFSNLMKDMIIVDDDINSNEVELYNTVADFCSIDVVFNEAISQSEMVSCTKS